MFFGLVFLVLVLAPGLQASETPCSVPLLLKSLEGLSEPEQHRHIPPLVARLVAETASASPDWRVAEYFNATNLVAHFGETALAALVEESEDVAPPQALAALDLLTHLGTKADATYPTLLSSLESLASAFSHSNATQSRVLFWAHARALLAIRPEASRRDLDRVLTACFPSEIPAMTEEDSGRAAKAWLTEVSELAVQLNVLKVGLPSLVDWLFGALRLFESHPEMLNAHFPQVSAALLRSELALGTPLTLVSQINAFLEETQGVPLLTSDLRRLMRWFSAFPILSDMECPEPLRLSVENLLEKLRRDSVAQHSDALRSPEGFATLEEVEETFVVLVETLKKMQFSTVKSLTQTIAAMKCLPYMDRGTGYQRYCQSRNERLSDVTSEWSGLNYRGKRERGNTHGTH
jgi:hypothetical protein